MFLNEMIMMAQAANIMVSLNATPNVTTAMNISTTTMSPEEKENKFGIDDRKYLTQHLKKKNSNNNNIILIN